MGCAYGLKRLTAARTGRPACVVLIGDITQREFGLRVDPLLVMRRQSVWGLVVFGRFRDVQGCLVCSGVGRVPRVQQRPPGGCQSWPDPSPDGGGGWCRLTESPRSCWGASHARRAWAKSVIDDRSHRQGQGLANPSTMPAPRPGHQPQPPDRCWTLEPQDLQTITGQLLGSGESDR